MLNGKIVLVVMPAYNAEKTLLDTVLELPNDVVDQVILVDDCSSDATIEIAKKLKLTTFRHEANKGYGANQKSCYREALKTKADIILMVHPDYQYSPKLVTAIAAMVTSGHYDIALGSRILGGNALKGGMPIYKYIANRFLSFFQNLCLCSKISEYHTGFRCWSRESLELIPFESFSDDFIFDNEILCFAILNNLRIGEISCPTHYFENSSSIDLKNSILYGVGVIKNSLLFGLKILFQKSN